MAALSSNNPQQLSRQARVMPLNTIIEEREEGGSNGIRSDSEGDGSDSTVIGKPVPFKIGLYTIQPKYSRLATVTNVEPSPVSSISDSQCDSPSVYSEAESARSSLSGSDAVTVFSENSLNSLPSLTSDPTSFDSASNRSSVRSSVSSNNCGRNRYPPLIIPHDAWNSIRSPAKDLPLELTTPNKIQLSTQALSALDTIPPPLHATPSLGSSSATRSPCVSDLSAPATPDLRSAVIEDFQGFGENESSEPDRGILIEVGLSHPPDVTLTPVEGEEETMILSPLDWRNIYTEFPSVPGAVPLEESPVTPACGRYGAFRNQPFEPGVRLPDVALQTLANLTRARSVDESSENSRGWRGQVEMRERSPIVRPASADGETPVSDFSLSQLSIPSPGGFFSSLKDNARNTWCVGANKEKSVPSTAIAERFYSLPWSQQDNIVETVLSRDETAITDGPPTARQESFNLKHSDEDEDLYGTGEAGRNSPESVRSAEYESAYQTLLKEAAEINIDRTGSWLTAQVSYLSALRDSFPNNGSQEYISDTHEDDEKTRPSSNNSSVRKSVRFLKHACEVASAANVSPASDVDKKDPIFHAAFEHLIRNRKRRDAFLHASCRQDAIRSLRIASPQKHIASLQGKAKIQHYERPRYKGPFSQNPRATGIFDRDVEALMYERVEREHLALNSILSPNWQIEALRIILQGRLLASAKACQRLTKKSTVPLDDPTCVGSKRLHILDFGGLATASWGWHAAHQWPNVKIYTVNTKQQTQSQRTAGENKPSGPSNHRTVSVPYLWQLPFKAGHFDVVSARDLHVLLKNNPVPGVTEIDEWDLTLRECLRVLKPGGYLDFVIMDSTIARAGPRGEAMSVEFGFELHRRGYEREAARTWLQRLKKHGFVDIKRAWMYLPMGRRNVAEQLDESGYTGGWTTHTDSKPFLLAPRPISEVSTISKIVGQYMDVEAVQGPVGSTQDAADITGLLGARMWEEWIVKLRKECGREDSRLLEGVDEMIEEGKEKGSGWKMLVGWARKPRAPVRQKSEYKVTPLESHEQISSPQEFSPVGSIGSIPVMIET